MKNTLIVGCSYTSMLKGGTNYDPNIDIFGSPGAGNASIAARVIYQLSQHSYKKVVILWSGIVRMDIPVDITLHNLYQLARKPYTFYDIQDQMAWYHSGGIFGVDMQAVKRYPDLPNMYFSNQYKTASSRFLTTQTLLNILSIQSLLKSKNIEYHMDFMYDIHKDYSETNFGYSLGQIDTTSPLYNLVDWNKLNQNGSIYEWAAQNNLLGDDLYHITSDGARAWFNDKYGTGLTKFVPESS